MKEPITSGGTFQESSHAAHNNAGVLSTTDRDEPPAALRGRTTPTASSCRIELITDGDSLFSLNKDWDDLYARAERPYVSQSFEWAWCAWKTLARSSDGQLRCLTVRRDGRLVLVWPMVVSRPHRFWSIAAPLGTPGDYTDVLAEE